MSLRYSVDKLTVSWLALHKGDLQYVTVNGLQVSSKYAREGESQVQKSLRFLSVLCLASLLAVGMLAVSTQLQMPTAQASAVCQGYYFYTGYPSSSPWSYNLDCHEFSPYVWNGISISGVTDSSGWGNMTQITVTENLYERCGSSDPWLLILQAIRSRSNTNYVSASASGYWQKTKCTSGHAYWQHSIHTFTYSGRTYTATYDWTF